MKQFLSLLLLLGAATWGHAQTLKGLVQEKTEQGYLPVAGAYVYWLNTQVVSSSDSSGHFEIPFAAGQNRLVISMLGFVNDTLLYQGEPQVSVTLKKAILLKDVLVSESQTSTYINPLEPIKTEQITEKELRKAACCNLSESFETNTSIDVNYADAVTGVKQIQMLGLEGKYSLLSIENQPRMRGLATNYGLSYIPGPWVESIQLSKGAGSVVNGYESISGQINVELKKAEKSEKLYFNQYVNAMGRLESNLGLSRHINKRWSTGLLLHGDLFDGKRDMNKDGFLDIPVNNQVGLLHRWKYSGERINGLETDFGIKLMQENRIGGQNGYKKSERGSTANYGVEMNTQRYEFFSKTGYLFESDVYKSVGLTINALSHSQQSWFGLKQYRGDEQSFYSNLIYQSVIAGNEEHKFRTGLSFMLDHYQETFDSLRFNRKESVPGAFFEYTLSAITRLDLIAGLRYDYHNLFGHIITPRLHIKYDINDRTVLRLSAGRGQRVANIFAENTSVFVSSRQLVILSSGGKAYGLNPEIAWNYGMNLGYDFKLFKRKGHLGMDLYHTEFRQQVIADREEAPNKILFYNLQGRSYSSSLQVELNYELVKRLNLKSAYRWLDMSMAYRSGSMQQALFSRNRFFANLEYNSKSKWSFDYTLQWHGAKRLPITQANPQEFELNTHSPSFFIMHAQISKTLKRWEFYLGVENLGDFRQKDLILDPANPFGPYFDSSLVWGPVIGRMVYAGLRYKIK